MHGVEIRSKAYLVVAFERPAMTQELLDFLISRDLKVYVFIDKGQTQTAQNQQMISSAQDYLNHPNVFVNIASESYGSQRGVEAALDWVFQKEEVVVVLEDDSVVTDASLKFFDETVDVLSDSVVIVSSRRILEGSYFGACDTHSHVSRFALTNGWMTSRNFWVRHYHREKPLVGFLKIKIDSLNPLMRWATKCFFFSGTARFELGIGKVGWDQKVVFTLLRDNLYSFVPNRTVMGNKGVDIVASNTKGLSEDGGFLYQADTEFPNFEIYSGMFCKEELNKRFIDLYGITFGNVLTPIKVLFEISRLRIRLLTKRSK